MPSIGKSGRFIKNNPSKQKTTSGHRGGLGARGGKGRGRFVANNVPLLPSPMGALTVSGVPPGGPNDDRSTTGDGTEANTPMYNNGGVPQTRTVVRNIAGDLTRDFDASKVTPDKRRSTPFISGTPTGGKHNRTMAELAASVLQPAAISQDRRELADASPSKGPDEVGRSETSGTGVPSSMSTSQPGTAEIRSPTTHMQTRSQF